MNSPFEKSPKHHFSADIQLFKLAAGEDETLSA